MYEALNEEASILTPARSGTASTVGGRHVYDKDFLLRFSHLRNKPEGYFRSRCRLLTNSFVNLGDIIATSDSGRGIPQRSGGGGGPQIQRSRPGARPALRTNLWNP